MRVGDSHTIADAIQLIEGRLAQAEFDLDDRNGLLSFSPRFFVVRDDKQRLAFAGQVWGAEIQWWSPVSSEEEADEVRAEADRLREEAAFEAGWDNFSTARNLRFQAVVLEGRLVDPIWRDGVRAALPDAHQFKPDVGKVP